MCPKELQMIPIDFITLYNRIDFRLRLAVSSTQEASVITTPFHHNCKVRQLICSLVNIQSMNVVFYNRKCCFSFVISSTFIDIHQDIEHCDQDMPTSHTWINTGNVCWFQVFICGTDFCQFQINSFFLLCLRKIVFPSESFCSCFFICTWIHCS